MKKYTNPTPIPPGGLPIYAAEFIDCLQSEIYRAITAPYLQYDEPLIINGCNIVANIGAGTVEISSGMAFLDGDLIDVPAYAGNFPVYLKQDVPTIITKLYKDKIARNVTITKQCSWSAVIPGAGAYITFDPYTSQYFRDVKRRYETAINALLVFTTYPDVNALDVTGLGKWAWKGFAVPNGNNGTINLKGRVVANYDPLSAKLYLGASVGEEAHLLTVAEMPAHRHSTDMRSGIASTGGTIGGQGSQGDGITGYQGNDAPHNNIQPTYAGVYLQRISV